MMEQWIYDSEDFHTGKWSGGAATEFAIFPQTAQYLERDFIWRLSSMQMEAEEASFTRLPDYDRILMVLEGEAVLAHGDQRTVKLTAWEQDCFDGAVKTKCFGRIKGYSLTMRKGCSGSLQLIHAKQESETVPKGGQGEFSNGSYGFYCLSGYVVVVIGQQTYLVDEGKQLILNFDADESEDVMVMGEGQALFAEIFYNKQAYVAEEIPTEKATFQDFKTAFRLCHSRYKWSRMLAKKTDVWYDEVLQRGLAFLEKSYIGLVIWVVVAVLLIALAFTGLSHALIAVMIVLWSILHVLLISPLIYMLVLPKPIKAHIKKTDDLTEYERKLYRKELGANPMTDKILKKYKYSGKENWDEGYQSIFRRLKK